MAMSRKQFQGIADCLNDRRHVLDSSLLSSERKQGYHDALYDVAQALATYCASQNPEFKRQRFLDACGVQ